MNSSVQNQMNHIQTPDATQMCFKSVPQPLLSLSVCWSSTGLGQAHHLTNCSRIETSPRNEPSHGRTRKLSRVTVHAESSDNREESPPKLFPQGSAARPARLYALLGTALHDASSCGPNAETHISAGRQALDQKLQGSLAFLGSGPHIPLASLGGSSFRDLGGLKKILHKGAGSTNISAVLILELSDDLPWGMYVNSLVAPISKHLAC